MDDLDKLRVMLPHWIEHNSGHGGEFLQWAGTMEAAGKPDIAELLKRAAASLRDAEAALAAALGKAGGPLAAPGHDHSHSVTGHRV